MTRKVLCPRDISDVVQVAGRYSSSKLKRQRKKLGQSFKSSQAGHSRGYLSSDFTNFLSQEKILLFTLIKFI